MCGAFLDRQHSAKAILNGAGQRDPPRMSVVLLGNLLLAKEGPCDPFPKRGWPLEPSHTAHLEQHHLRDKSHF